MSFFSSLRFKIIASSILIEIVMLAILITNNAKLVEGHLTEQAQQNLQDRKASFQASILPLLIIRDYGSLNSLLDEYTNSKKIEFIFIKKDDDIIASSKWDSKNIEPKVSDKFNTDSNIFYAKTNLNYGGQDYGDIYFGIDTTFLQKAKEELVVESFFIALFAIIISIFLLSSIGYLLTKNLKILTNAAESLSNNNFNINLDIKTKDEVGFLAKAFNKMVVQITSQLSTIQEQNKVQEELIVSLDEENARVRAILENAGDEIHILDLDGNVVMFSDSFASSLGYSKEEAQSLNISDWEKDYNLRDIQNSLEESKTFEAVHIRKDGTSFPVEVRTTGVMLNGKVYVYGSSRNITERKMSQDELRQKDMLLYQQSKMASMGEMIGNIAHQWRQPLSVISTSVTGLNAKISFGLKVEENEIVTNLDRVNDTVQYLSKTIDDFQQYLKPQTNQTEFNIKDVINKNLEMFGKAFESSDIKIVMNTEDVFIKNNQNELLQVIINILNNAKDALKEFKVKDRIIFISLHNENNQAILSIKDNAGGIPKEVLPKIFDAYFTTKHKSQGTGLGLYMSYQIITNRFKGNIEVCNETYEYQEKEYTGANFKVILPL